MKQEMKIKESENKEGVSIKEQVPKEDNQVPEQEEEFSLGIPTPEEVSIEVRDVNDFIGYNQFGKTIKQTMEDLGF